MMHEHVSGTTPDGQTYRALDQDLLTWVAAPAGFGFLTAYDRFVAPLDDGEKTRFFREGEEIASLYGVRTPVGSLEEFDALMRSLEPHFEPHPILFDFLKIVERPQGRTTHLPRWLTRAFVQASVSILPHRVRERLELGPAFDLSRAGALAVRTVARLAARIPARTGPAARACARGPRRGAP